MFQYKIAPPLLPGCLDRPRLTRLVLPHQIVVLAAPAGLGKTCFAAQVAAATGGPTAWFLADELDRGRAEIAGQLRAALGVAWTELDLAAAPPLDGDVAISLLGAALRTVAGPGCVVMDDVHLLPAAALDAVLRTVVATLPPGCRLVLCTRTVVPEAIVRAQAAGRAVTLGAGDLAFDPDECAHICASTGTGVAALERTGGWPLAVALLARSDSAANAATAYHHVAELADLALAELSPAGRDLLAVLARIPRFPVRLLRRLRDGDRGLDEFGRRHPELLARDGDWWAPREWLRDALGERTAEPRLVRRVATVLSDLDEDELATELLVAEARYEDALPALERLAAEGLRQGRPAWVRSLLAPVPTSARTLWLDVHAAGAAQALNDDDGSSPGLASEQALLDLVSRAVDDSTGCLLPATALLANHYRMQGDARLLTVCQEALGGALDVESPEKELAGRWKHDQVSAAAEMLRYFGQALLFAPDARAVERGSRLVAAALNLLEAVGRPTLSLRAWSTYFEVLLFLRNPVDALASVRLAAHRMAELEHSDSAVRLAELATLEFFAGDHHAARASIERARDCAERTGNRIALSPLAAIEVALDVAARSYLPEHDDRFRRVAAELSADPCLARFTALITAEFGIVLAKQGRPGTARRYLELARSSLDSSFFAHVSKAFRCRRLEGLLQAAEGSLDQARETLGALRDDALTEGRVALVTLIESDLADIGLDRPAPHRDHPLAPLRVHTLAPQLAVTAGGERMPVPRGYPAKLLALLIACRGCMTVDTAIEELWPGADPDVGRNRLHGVLLRLRRGLGLPASGPITCTDDMVRLEATHCVEVDSWEFADQAAVAPSEPAQAWSAIGLYHHDLLSVQFAYDDAIEAYRRDLRRQFLQLAARLLNHPVAGTDPDDLAELARRVARLAPEDEDLCLAAAATLTRLGRGVDAAHVVDTTARSLEDLGIDAVEFRRRAAV